MVKNTVDYKTVDSLTLHVDVDRPEEDQIRPVVFWVHGGALVLASSVDIAPVQLDG